MAYIDLGRDWCSALKISGTHEWLVTNGIGGYAKGTVAGVLTRRYHGLLIAALNPPVGRTLLLTKLDETAFYDDKNYPLFSNRWKGGEVEPGGHHHIERFRLEGTTPVWTFALGDAQLEKRIWMQPGANTTYIRYELARAIKPIEIEIKALVNYRDHHANTRKENINLEVDQIPEGIKVGPHAGELALFLLSKNTHFRLEENWHEDYYLELEDYRGLDPIDDNLAVGIFYAILSPGEAITLVASTYPEPNLDEEETYAERQAYENELISQSNRENSPEELKQLILAADQFIVTRNLPQESKGRSIIAGYPWFGDWGRDTMISLPGLTLTTGREEVAATILRTFARYIDQGMLPNNFPEVGEIPDYNTVDATLWYFEALRAYYAKSGDREFLEEIYPVLIDIINWHERGTRYNIHLDPDDGLVYAGDYGVQLTWMDAKVGDWVVTPRIGKPVEVNALWYNALRIMVDFAKPLNHPMNDFLQKADKAQRGFARFWNQSDGYCFDVLDGPEGNDASLRPNQLLAVALPHSPLTKAQQKSIVDVCAQKLWTSHGLRSLATTDPNFIGQYGGDQRQRDGAYHQGTVWGWLIGPFISAHLRVYHDPELAMTHLEPFMQQMKSHGLGNLSEIFDGEAPFKPRGCIAQAWSVAEVLRSYEEIYQESQ